MRNANLWFIIRCFDFPKIYTMSRIVRAIIQKSSYRNITEKRLTMVNLFSIYVSVQRLLNNYPNYSTHRVYFGEVETPYSALAVGWFRVNMPKLLINGIRCKIIRRCNRGSGYNFKYFLIKKRWSQYIVY